MGNIRSRPTQNFVSCSKRRMSSFSTCSQATAVAPESGETQTFILGTTAETSWRASAGRALTRVTNPAAGSGFSQVRTQQVRGSPYFGHVLIQVSAVQQPFQAIDS